MHATYEEKLSHVVKSLAQVEEKIERMSSGVGVHGKKQNKRSKKKNGNDSNESPNQQTCLASAANSDAVLNWASTCPSEIEELSSEAEEEGHSTRGRSKTRQRSRTKRHNAMANGESSSRPGSDTRPNTGTKPHQRLPTCRRMMTRGRWLQSTSQNVLGMWVQTLPLSTTRKYFHRVKRTIQPVEPV